MCDKIAKESYKSKEKSSEMVKGKICESGVKGDKVVKCYVMLIQKGVNLQFSITRERIVILM